MDGKVEEKITFVTKSQLAAYRIWIMVVAVALTLGLLFRLYLLITQFKFPFDLFIGIVILYKLWRTYVGLKPVEFDREFLYVTEKGYDIIVPLENVKSVEIKSLGGLYKIIFYDRIQSGYEIFFMPSLIYPLDYGKQDAKVNILRSYAEKAKLIKHPRLRNALQS